MSNQMSKQDAARVQSTQAKGDKDMSSNGFAARAQSAGDKNANASGGGAGGNHNAGGGQAGGNAQAGTPKK
ncbi:uncharacterized protein RSE6_13133 [Rhynchosporium secalis]|uniref:SMP domain-containing protein n=1 Tax=Rhynchosporium secalis TaxID=38038 RepID=A0A1E1MS37_RHYSE|nr:uncharacterized protein RSE6_13133 [Rhynchosporium secalis]